LCIAVLALVTAALPSRAAADTPLGPLLAVPLDGTTPAYTSPVTAGGLYRIVMTGTAIQTGGTASPGSTVDYDALYCFRQLPVTPFTTCTPSTPVRRPDAIVVHYPGAASHDLDGLNPQTQLPYDGGPAHRYEETFIALRSGPLQVYRQDFGCPTCYTHRGNPQITLQLYLVAPPPPPTPKPPGKESGAIQLIAAAAAWGPTGPPFALDPGGQAIATSPPIGSKQKDLKVTVSGDPGGNTTAVFAPSANPPLSPADFRRMRHDCLFTTAVFGRYLAPGTRTGKVEDPLRFYWILEDILACLEYVKQLESPYTRPASARAAARSCGLLFRAITWKTDRATRVIRWRTRRHVRREPARRLDGSCRQARNGALTMRIRSLRRTKLRKFLGRRLHLGISRHEDAQGTANVQVTFDRR
jgi:hypothetical protein